MANKTIVIIGAGIGGLAAPGLLRPTGRTEGPYLRGSQPPWRDCARRGSETATRLTGASTISPVVVPGIHCIGCGKNSARCRESASSRTGLRRSNHLNVLAQCSRHNYGFPIGGSLPFSQAIEHRFRELGGEISYRTTVLSILKV